MSVRLALRDDAPRGTPLVLPRQNFIGPALIVAGMFVIFAAILVRQIAHLNLQALGSVSDLASMLFDLCFALAWSVAVMGLGAFAVFLLFFGDSARIAGGRLIYVLNLGPFKMITEYELARMRNLRVEDDAGGERVRVRFEYDEVEQGLGDLMPPNVARWNLKKLLNSMAVLATTQAAEPVNPLKVTPPRFDPPAEVAQRRLPLFTMLVLVCANLIPLLGVLFGGWTLAEVMVLFWAESAVIGFYTLLKIAVVAKWLAPFAGLLFAGHFGGFMAGHFFFIYELFVRGIDAVHPDPGAVEALTRLFMPLWPALLALLLSHGVSFVRNFLAQREYEGATVQSLMAAPYVRIFLMQFTLILGGWGVMLLHNPVPALVLLIVLKVAFDLRGHSGERASKS